MKRSKASDKDILKKQDRDRKKDERSKAGDSNKETVKKKTNRENHNQNIQQTSS